MTNTNTTVCRIICDAPLSQIEDDADCCERRAERCDDVNDARLWRSQARALRLLAETLRDQ